MANVTRIKPLESYENLGDNEVVSRGLAVYTGTNGNPHFPNPPVSPTDLKAGLDSYSSLIAESQDGSRKVIAQRKKQRKAVINMLRMLARYVEIASDGDMAVFMTSGFQPASTTKASPAPLAVPDFKKIDHGPNSGEILIQVKKVAKAQIYEVQYAANPAGGVPSAWTKMLVPSTKPVTVTGLTPGTVYAFQVRAAGKLGYTDWSDSVTLMCT
jgi:Fibronectin type III domain